jgi:F420 biosynthesis protein FbiB-like protein
VKQKLAKAMADVWVKDLTVNGVSAEVRENLVEASINRFVRSPVLILACITLEEMDEYPDIRRREFEHLMATQSLAAAIQNLLLAAHFQGLGSCWFCAPLFCQEAVRKVLGIPADVEPQALITLGYPSEKPEPPPRKTLKEVVFKNRWGEAF